MTTTCLEIDHVGKALAALANADGTSYRGALSDLHVACEALARARDARYAWLDKNFLRRFADGDPRNERLDRHYAEMLRGYCEMCCAYAEAYRAVTAYAVVVEEPAPIASQPALDGMPAPARRRE